MNVEPANESPKIHLGCPVWACAQWVGSLYRSSSRRTWLNDYSTVFNTVEGNSTFYALPSKDVVSTWAAETNPGFRFALKFPREITHDLQLVGADTITKEFLALLEVLADSDRLGPSFLQLPPYFSGESLEVLQRFLKSLPREFPFAVEVRHDDFFHHQQFEQRLDEMLSDCGIDRVLFDSRGLFAKPPEDETERESQRRKPRLPFRDTVTGRHPFVRFVGRNKIEQTEEWLNQWVPIVAKWMKQGLEPYFFTHAPDDEFAPEMGALFYERLQKEIEMLKPMSPWPGRTQPKQLDLF